MGFLYDAVKAAEQEMSYDRTRAVEQLLSECCSSMTTTNSNDSDSDNQLQAIYKDGQVGSSSDFEFGT